MALPLPVTRVPARAGASLPASHHDTSPPAQPTLMRRIEIMTLCRDHPGDIVECSRTVPAAPIFEEAVAAFAHGAQIPTERGLVAVEDLLPGDKVKTVGRGFRTLLWRGGTTLVADVPGQSPEMGRLTRVAADALGIARPMHDLVLGPMANLVRHGAAIERLTGHRAAALPARDLIDGMGVVELRPPSAVQVFHLGFERHERILANGVEVESYHPGPARLARLSPEDRALFLSCFPHLERIEDFGPPALPRLRLAELDQVA
ncbi:Hint domain-containing protein [Limimaricola variabilis]|uniref:Hint domain-containing protein n=1 Tax=Limimaricola variabilis TaxID=1492771 RepID=UPI002AC9092D|nr:Hint domain-containing protein [Limimaricola variabilis]WPY94281.1 Hint domain-containing protein [Limimaricola variabilis]